MNIEARNELMEIVNEISRLAPYIRLGQLMGLMTSHLDEPYGVNSIVEVEDAELLPAAKHFLESFQNMDKEYRLDQIRAHLESDQYAIAQDALTAS